MLKVGVKEALNCSRLLPVTRHHKDLKLSSKRSVESHTLIALWGEFRPTLENFVTQNATTIRRNEGCLHSPRGEI